MTAHRSRIRRLIAPVLAAAMLGAAFTGGDAASAAPPLAIEMGVYPSGTEATVYVRPTTSELITVSHSLRRVTTGGQTVPPTRLPIRDVAAPLSGVLSTGGVQPPPVYLKEAKIRLTGLQPNTAYEVTVNAATASGQTAVARQTFTTLKQRVRITLDKIVVHDDGDGFLAGKGEPTWLWSVEGFSGGPLRDCFPKNSAGRCGVAETGEVTLLPRTRAGQPFSYVFAQENFVPVVNPNQQPGDEDFTSMPHTFTVRATAKGGRQHRRPARRGPQHDLRRLGRAAGGIAGGDLAGAAWCGVGEPAGDARRG